MVQGLTWKQVLVRVNGLTPAVFCRTAPSLSFSICKAKLAVSDGLS